MNHLNYSLGHIKDLKKEHSMGTTIMAMKYKDGVIIGADSRTTTGAYIANRVSDKLTPVHDYIYCCRSGSAADTEAVAGYVSYYLDLHTEEKGELPTVKTAANLFKDICYSNKNALSASIICAGWDKRRGGSVYSIPLGGSLVEQEYSVGGSGSIYLYGYMDDHYKSDLSKDQALKLIVKAISLAMARDGSSGGVVRTAVINKDGVERNAVSNNKLGKFYWKE